MTLPKQCLQWKPIKPLCCVLGTSRKCRSGEHVLWEIFPLPLGTISTCPVLIILIIIFKSNSRSIGKSKPLLCSLDLFLVVPSSRVSSLGASYQPLEDTEPLRSNFKIFGTAAFIANIKENVSSHFIIMNVAKHPGSDASGVLFISLDGKDSNWIYGHDSYFLADWSGLRRLM